MPTTSPPDLGPAADAMTRAVTAVRDDQLHGPTPCPDWTLADLLHHVEGLTMAFTRAARKESLSPEVDTTPVADGSRLRSDWRSAIPAQLEEMVRAWREPEAWSGRTEVGGVELPGHACGSVGLDELVVHGWDVARATGQPYAIDEGSVAGAMGFVAAVSGENAANRPPGIFGPEVRVRDDADPLTRLLGATGRDAGWVGPA